MLCICWLLNNFLSRTALYYTTAYGSYLVPKVVPKSAFKRMYAELISSVLLKSYS